MFLIGVGTRCDILDCSHYAAKRDYGQRFSCC